ncbi:hypothetical protein [Streptomyces sp. URMC 123]|uniref:hypothetical protein n=1 Tax=Streptomyces sp. URMC 123 TaxID=3423403 RepID=UPI003F1A4FB6
MLDQRVIEYFRFQGARTLLSVFRGTIPMDEGQRREALEPAMRALWQEGQRGGRTPYEVAGQLRELARLFAESPGQPPYGAKNIPRTAAEADMPAALEQIATYVEQWKRAHFLKLKDVAPPRWELMRRFPRLHEFLTNYYGQAGIVFDDDLTEREGLALFIDHWHPACLWELPAIIGECHEALATFHTDEALTRFFTDHVMGSGTLTWPEWIPLIAETFSAHLREQHPPVWQET